jgi:hypothetical protein
MTSENWRVVAIVRNYIVYDHVVTVQLLAK